VINLPRTSSSRSAYAPEGRLDRQKKLFLQNEPRLNCGRCVENAANLLGFFGFESPRSVEKIREKLGKKSRKIEKHAMFSPKSSVI
jgi:hypothetical protein